MELVGRVFGHLRVLSRGTPTKHRMPRWYCECSCGEKRLVSQGNLLTGNSTNCGCRHGVRISNPITQQQLKTVLRYDPITGKFYWKVVTRNSRPGDEAGCFHKDNGYVRISLNRRGYYAHILAWLYVTGEWPKNEIDHRDMDGENNCWTNLRCATHTQNNQNIRKRAHNKSGYKGVIQKKDRFIAKIVVNRRIVQLGMFDSAEQAARAYDAAATKYFGEFARPNFEVR